MAFLELDGVHKRFAANHVLRGVDLHVDQHDVVCLIGPSGCGKSTLLRCINALEEIDEGAIHIDGEQASGRGVDLDGLRQDVGIVFQAFNLFPHMTVLDNVTLAPRKVLGLPRKQANARALTLLARIGLDDITSALDPELVSEVLNIVRELAAERMTMLLATHEMSFAREVSTKVCFLDAGVICEEGPPEQIFGEPQNDRTRIFLKRIIEAGRL